MKILFVTLSLILTTFCQSQSWSYLGNAGFSGSTANYLSLAIDLQSDKIFVAYQDFGDEGKLNISFFDNTSSEWININNDNDLSSGYANHNSISIDANGNPYYSFIDGDNNVLGFGYLKSNGNWVANNPTNGGSSVSGHSINSITKQDYDGDVFVCSYHSSWNIVVYRASAVTSNFSIYNSFPGDRNISSLSFDMKYNSGYIAFSNLDDEGRIDIIKIDGGSMSVLETYDNVSDGLSNYIDLEINPLTLLPYIAFQDIANGGGVTVKKLNGDNWELVGEEVFSGGLSNYIDLAFDVNGVPYVAFQDVSFSNKLSVMTYNGTTWEYVGERGVSPASASHCSIELNSDGEIFLAFKDGSASNQASVLRYGATLSIDNNDLNSYVLSPNPANDKLTIDGVSDYDAKIYNDLGQFIMKTNNTNTIDVSTLSKGIYFIKVSDGINSSIKKFIKN